MINLEKKIAEMVSSEMSAYFDGEYVDHGTVKERLEDFAKEIIALVQTSRGTETKNPEFGDIIALVQTSRGTETKNPEFGDIIVTNNGMRWVCADSETIKNKISADPDIYYKNDEIKAYAEDPDSLTFMTWKSRDSSDYSWEYRIKEVIRVV